MSGEENAPSGPTSNNRDLRGTFGRIPNDVVLDPRLSASPLALLAYRRTKVGNFALSEDAAALGLPLSDGSRGRKIGRSQFKRSIRQLTQAGYLKRRQRPSQGRASFGYAIETVHVPEATWDRICREWWHDGSLSTNAIAALLFIRAFNCPIGLHALRKRFKWGKKRARDAVKELLAASLIIQMPGAKRTYRDAEVLAQEEGGQSAAAATDEKPSDETPSDDKASHTRSDRSSRKDQEYKKERAPRKRYGIDAKASNPDPSLGHNAHGDRPGPIDPWASDNLLGWATGDDRGLASRLSFLELSRDTFAEVECVASDEVILDGLRAATEGRVAKDIMSPAGAQAVRLLAAVLVEDQGCTPEHALNDIFDYLQQRIGNRQDGWLGSLKLVGLRVAGSVAAGENGLQSHIEAMLSEIREADRGEVLHPNLFRQPRGFKGLVKKYGTDTVIDVIRYVLTRVLADGKDPQSIKTWDYFKDPLEDARLSREGSDEDGTDDISSPPKNAFRSE